MNTYIVWKRLKDQRIDDQHEVMTLFQGTQKDADDFVKRLNADTDDSPYWRSYDMTVVTSESMSDWLE